MKRLAWHLGLFLSLVSCAEVRTPALPSCGDGLINGGENCDDGNRTDGDGCSASCKKETPNSNIPAEPIPPTFIPEPPKPPPAVCGNAATEPGEICDDGDIQSGDGCSGDCRSEETCGNGYLDQAKGEVCDDGNTIGGDGCSGDCKSNESCGNRILDIEAGETCDDGNSQNSDGCDSNCKREPPPGCGNGLLESDEVCDDSNRTDGDGCSGDCLSDETCGNNIVDTVAGEACDDGNLVSGDRCTPMCQRDAPMCRIDENLGTPQPGVVLSRNLNIAQAGDEWDTGCSRQGRDYVLQFSLERPGDISVIFTQSGDHAVGLYRESDLTSAACSASQGVCLNQGLNRPGGVVFRGRPSGTYFLITESNGYTSAGTINLSLFVVGCAVDGTLGTLGSTGTLTTTIDTTTGLSTYRAGCAGNTSGKERVLAFSTNREVDLNLAWNQTGEHVIALTEDGGGLCTERAVTCVYLGQDNAGNTTVRRLRPGNYLLMIDAYDPGKEGSVQLGLSTP